MTSAASRRALKRGSSAWRPPLAHLRTQLRVGKPGIHAERPRRLEHRLSRRRGGLRGFGGLLRPRGAVEQVFALRPAEVKKRLSDLARAAFQRRGLSARDLLIFLPPPVFLRDLVARDALQLKVLLWNDAEFRVKGRPVGFVEPHGIAPVVRLFKRFLACVGELLPVFRVPDSEFLRIRLVEVEATALLHGRLKDVRDAPILVRPFNTLGGTFLLQGKQLQILFRREEVELHCPIRRRGLAAFRLFGQRTRQDGEPVAAQPVQRLSDEDFLDGTVSRMGVPWRGLGDDSRLFDRNQAIGSASAPVNGRPSAFRSTFVKLKCKSALAPREESGGFGRGS